MSSESECSVMSVLGIDTEYKSKNYDPVLGWEADRLISYKNLSDYEDYLNKYQVKGKMHVDLNYENAINIYRGKKYPSDFKS